MTQSNPVLVGISLSSTFIPAMNKASDLLRRAYPEQSDGELLERILIYGICSIIDSHQNHPAKQCKL